METGDRFKLHGAVYTDPSIFAWEMEQLLECSWVFLAHEGLVQYPNDYWTTRIGRQPVILCRDGEGKLHCFLNRCRHKGMKVCRSQQGNSSRFRCMYHSWTYRNTGELLNLPDRKGYGPDSVLQQLGLIEVPNLVNFHGLIFASLSPSAVPFEDYLGNAAAYLARLFRKETKLVAGIHRYTLDCNWKLHMENSVDCYHVPFVHATTYSSGGSEICADYRFEPSTLNKGIYIGNGHYATTLRLTPSVPESGRKLIKEWGFGAAEGDDEGLICQFSLFPNLVVLGNWQLIRHFQPLSVNQTEVTYYYYHPRDADMEMQRTYQRLRDEFFGGGSGTGSPDDVVVLQNLQQALEAVGVDSWEAPYNDLSKGLQRETAKVDDGLPPYELAGHASDDAHYRGFYRWWAQQWEHRVRKQTP